MTNPKQPVIEQLETIFPETETIKVGGLDVNVRELGVAKIANFARLLAPVFARFPNLGPDDDMYPILLAAGPAVIEGIAFAVDMPLEWVGNLRPGEFAKLVAKVQELNRDFFASGPGSVVSGAMATLLITAEVKATTPTAEPSGAKPSTHLSDTDTEPSSKSET